jgi:hypothetical protein
MSFATECLVLVALGILINFNEFPSLIQVIKIDF